MINRIGRVLFGTTQAVRSQVCEAVSAQLWGNHTNVRTMASSLQKTLTLKTLNPNMIRLQNAESDPLVMRSIELRKELEKGIKKPFKKIINANIEDAQAMGQKPITFIRQVLACVIYPELLNSDKFPSDVKETAQDILCGCGGHSTGAYKMSYGIELIRRHVAEYIERRDGHKAIWQDICLVEGATSGIKSCLQLCKKTDGKNSGVMIPIPQYPLYSATLAEYGLGQIGYYLDEDKNWALDVAELERAFKQGSTTHAVRALVVINPGNPTGQVLTRENIECIIKFAQKYSLFLFADEVCQDNVYHGNNKFFSFKKVMTEMGPPYYEMKLASFMSISKGYMGECGLRGGWMELVNLDPDVQTNLYKAISAMHCPNITGQTAIECVVRSPCPGEPSYHQWLLEKISVLDSLRERSKIIVETFNKMTGLKCNIVQGAMYAFPRITLPPKAVAAAKAANMPADTFYAFRLLEETGILIDPGSKFGQRPGTYHFRITILPQPKYIREMLKVFKVFHRKFIKEYS